MKIDSDLGQIVFSLFLTFLFGFIFYADGIHRDLNTSKNDKRIQEETQRQIDFIKTNCPDRYSIEINAHYVTGHCAK